MLGDKCSLCPKIMKNGLYVIEIYDSTYNSYLNSLEVCTTCYEKIDKMKSERTQELKTFHKDWYKKDLTKEINKIDIHIKNLEMKKREHKDILNDMRYIKRRGKR